MIPVAGARTCTESKSESEVSTTIVRSPLPAESFGSARAKISYSCGPNDTREAVAHIRRGAVRAEGLVTHRFPLERTEEAFRVTSEAGDSLKAIVLVDPGQDSLAENRA